jgi:hypothetical protein
MVGEVVYPTQKANPEAFTASKWIGTGEVAATAVNAIHLKANGGQTVFSLLPKEFLSTPNAYNSYLSPNSSIYTNINAGEKIFGGGYSPFVGNKVFINNQLLTKSIMFGDVLTILVTIPAEWPKAIIFENKVGGKVTMKQYNDTEKVIAKVIKPVTGVGRFSGSRYIASGRIRANHPGVIDISTSAGERLGGFQIIPSNHSNSTEMRSSKTMAQWMIVGPNKVSGEALEGKPPLFKYFIKPQCNDADIYSTDWENLLLKRYLVECKIASQEGWKPLPVFAMRQGDELSYEAHHALDKVTHIRILFPLN